MIPKFGADTALLLIDVQTGVFETSHWGGPTGRMNNPAATDHLRNLLTAFRASTRQIAFTRHNSVEPDSPLKFGLPTGAQIDGLEIAHRDILAEKSVNSGFVGTTLDRDLKAAGISRLVVAGFFTNFCVETTVRMAGNMGYDVYLAHDACATCNRIDLAGRDHDPDLVHDLAVASMHGEFCTALTTDALIGLLSSDVPHLSRAQGNETTSARPEKRIA
ncbi:MAG: isochorismatase family protein [Arenibacterium sp.]